MAFVIILVQKGGKVTACENMLVCHSNIFDEVTASADTKVFGHTCMFLMAVTKVYSLGWTAGLTFFSFLGTFCVYLTHIQILDNY